MYSPLMKDVKLRKVKAATGSGSSDVASSIIDMQGYEGVVFFTTIGTANAGNYMKVQQDVLNAASSMADLEGTKVVAAGNGDVVMCDVFRPSNRYLRAYMVNGATTTFGDIYALQYGARKKPADNNESSAIVSETHVSPAEGTA